MTLWLTLLMPMAVAQDEGSTPWDAGAEPAEPTEAAAPAESPPPADEDGPSDETSPDDPVSAVAMRRDARDDKRMERARKVYAQRALANHPFIVPQFAKSALPTTNLSGGFGGGAWLDLTGQAPSAVLVGGDLGVGVRFHPWVGMYVEAEGLAGISTDSDDDTADGDGALGDDSVFALGAWDVHGALPIRVVHGRSTAFSLVPTGHYEEVVDLGLTRSLTNVAEQLANDEQVNLGAATSDATSRASRYGGQLHLALAQSAGSFFGVQASLGGGAEEVRVRKANGQQVDARYTRGTLHGGVALSFDANPVPFAAMIEYGADVGFGLGELSGTTSVVHDVGLGLYINGLTNTVGIETHAELSEGQLILLAQLAFRAYY